MLKVMATNTTPLQFSVSPMPYAVTARDVDGFVVEVTAADVQAVAADAGVTLPLEVEVKAGVLAYFFPARELLPGAGVHRVLRGVKTVVLSVDFEE